jgi:hypothetical protein
MIKSNTEFEFEFNEDDFVGMTVETGTTARITTIHVSARAESDHVGFWTPATPFFGSSEVQMERDGKKYPTPFSLTLTGSFVASTESIVEVSAPVGILWDAFKHVLTPEGREQLAANEEAAKFVIPNGINLYRNTFAPITNALAVADIRPNRAKYLALVTGDGKLCYLRLKNSAASRYVPTLDRMIEEVIVTAKGNVIPRHVVQQITLSFKGESWTAESKDGKKRSKMKLMSIEWSDRTTPAQRETIKRAKDDGTGYLADIEARYWAAENVQFIPALEAVEVFAQLGAGEATATPPALSHRSVVIEDAVPF